MELLSTVCLIFGLVILNPAEHHASRIYKGSVQSQSASIRTDSEDTLLFPEDNPTLSKVNLPRDVTRQLKATPCPGDKLFCEDADDYPSNYIKDLLEKQPNVGLNRFYVEAPVAEVNRFGFEGEEHALCPSEVKTVFPQKGQSREGVFEFIVNEENHKQGITVETCLEKDGKSCNIPGSFSNGYTSHCIQKNVLRQLIVVNSNKSDVNGFVSKTFEFPSCCACKIFMTGGGDRSGFGLDHNTTPANNVKG